MNITVTPRISRPGVSPFRFEPQARSAQPPAQDRYVPAQGETPVDPPVPAKPGDTREFWTWDMSVMPPGQKRVHTTCRSVGEHTNVWVDDSVWERLVTEDDVNILERRLERQAPTGATDPRKGIAELNHDYFGKPPVGLDGDPKVNVLLTEFAAFKGTVMDGYFNAFDTLTEKEAQEYDQHSNESEVIYLNSASRRISSDYMQGVLAHEYSHLLQYPHDGDEESWLGETLGEVAMKVNGYHTDMGHVARHQTRPDRPLVSQTYVDYGACMLFGTYLTEQYGQGFIQDLTANPENGIESINSTLAGLGQDKNFDGIYKDWVVANYADSRGVATPGLHYSTLDVPAPAEMLIESTNFQEESKLKPTGARYYRLPEGNMSLSLQSEQQGLTAEILEFDGKKMTRRPLESAAELENHPDRVLCVGSLGAEELTYQLTLTNRETV
jgi:hypothetical protein